MKKEMLTLDDALAKKLAIHREAEGGFQRKFQSKRMPEMVHAFTVEGRFCPAITVGKFNNKLYLIDGQHRFAAWKIKQFPLNVEIVHFNDEKQMIDGFVDMNREQKRLSFSHILKVSKEDYAVRVRKLAEETKSSHSHVHRLMLGLLNNKDPRKVEIEQKHWELAIKALAFWTSQKRWAREENIFSSLPVMEMLGFFVQKASNPDSMLQDLLKLDYSRTSRLARVVGGSHQAQKQMRAIAYQVLAEMVI